MYFCAGLSRVFRYDSNSRTMVVAPLTANSPKRDTPQSPDSSVTRRVSTVSQTNLHVEPTRAIPNTSERLSPSVSTPVTQVPSAASSPDFDTDLNNGSFRRCDNNNDDDRYLGKNGCLYQEFKIDEELDPCNEEIDPIKAFYNSENSPEAVQAAEAAARCPSYDFRPPTRNALFEGLSSPSIEEAKPKPRPSPLSEVLTKLKCISAKGSQELVTCGTSDHSDKLTVDLSRHWIWERGTPLENAADISIRKKREQKQLDIVRAIQEAEAERVRSFRFSDPPILFATQLPLDKQTALGIAPGPIHRPELAQSRV